MPQRRTLSHARFLTLHFILFQAATSLAGGFIGAYILRCGFSMAAALGAYAGYLTVRSLLRFACLGAVQAWGYRSGLIIGTLVIALQFFPLLHAADPRYLFGWMVCLALGEAFYWPIYHAAMASLGEAESRGRQVAQRTMVSTITGIAGPLCGAFLLTRFGPRASFLTATALMVLSAAPLLRLRGLAAGPVPRLTDTFRIPDPIAIAAFAADGWLSSGLTIAWPMVLYSALGGHFAALGAQNAAAGLAGAAASWVCGRAIDDGRRQTLLDLVCILLAGGFVLRAVASFSPYAASAASLSGAAITALYTPVLMSVIYDRAKRSGAMFRFHFIAEAGWDAGAVLGCAAAAAVALLNPGAASLCVLPAMGGIVLIHRCVSAGGAARGAVLDGAAA